MEKLIQHYDNIAETYHLHYGDTIFKAEDRMTYSIVKLQGRVLDVGCGTGQTIDNTIVDPNNYVGIDLAEQMVKNARLRHPNYCFILDDFLRHRGQYDTIIALYEPMAFMPLEAAANSVYENLSPGGKAYLHYLGGNRKLDTPTGVFDCGNPELLLYASKKVVDVYASKFRSLRVVKQNLLYQYKRWCRNVSLLTKLMQIESRLPFNFKYFSWILLEVVK